MKTVGEVAEMAGLTVETRHYDRIGLLEPGARSAAGYRLYGSEELLRLREILVWWLLGFSLASVAALLDAPEHDRTAALVRQRELVGEQRRQFAGMTQVSIGRLLPSAGIRADPIRVAESLSALGIVPVGTGTYQNRSRKLRPWPPLVEQPIRDVVRETGLYGSDVSLVELAQPDLIIDLLLHGDVPLTRDPIGVGSLAAIAPTVTVDVDGSPPVVPRFRSVLPAVAEAVGREDRVESLLALWEARTAAVRAQLGGQEVSVLVLWSDDRLRTPNERYASQVLTSLGLSEQRAASGARSLGCARTPPGSSRRAAGHQ